MEQVLQFLQANDITVGRAISRPARSRRDATNYQDAGWADCELAIGTDRSSDNARPRRARQRLDRAWRSTIAVREAAGATQVTLDATFTERQIHPWRNLPFDAPCRSTGVLEKALLDAI